MGDVLGSLNYDFKAVRDRIQDYRWQYNVAKRAGDEELVWMYMGLIEMLEGELEKKHKGENGKMTSGQGRHTVIHIENIITPIVSQWTSSGKEETIDVS